MTARKFSWLLAGVCLVAAAPTASAQSFFLKKGDVVVIMGDSITEQQLYSNYVEMWSQTRFPAYHWSFATSASAATARPAATPLQAGRAALQAHGADRRFWHERRQLHAIQGERSSLT